MLRWISEQVRKQHRGRCYWSRHEGEGAHTLPKIHLCSRKHRTTKSSFFFSHFVCFVVYAKEIIMVTTWGTFWTDPRSSLLAHLNWLVSLGSKTWHLLTCQEGFCGAETGKANLKFWLVRSRLAEVYCQWAAIHEGKSNSCSPLSSGA